MKLAILIFLGVFCFGAHYAFDHTRVRRSTSDPNLLDIFAKNIREEIYQKMNHSNRFDVYSFHIDVGDIKEMRLFRHQGPLNKRRVNSISFDSKNEYPVDGQITRTREVAISQELGMSDEGLSQVFKAFKLESGSPKIRGDKVIKLETIAVPVTATSQSVTVPEFTKRTITYNFYEVDEINEYYLAIDVGLTRMSYNIFNITEMLGSTTGFLADVLEQAYKTGGQASPPHDDLANKMLGYYDSETGLTFDKCPSNCTISIPCHYCIKNIPVTETVKEVQVEYVYE